MTTDFAIIFAIFGYACAIVVQKEPPLKSAKPTRHESLTFVLGLAFLFTVVKTTA